MAPASPPQFRQCLVDDHTVGINSYSNNILFSFQIIVRLTFLIYVSLFILFKTLCKLSHFYCNLF
jgi:hypothetical protein